MRESTIPEDGPTRAEDPLDPSRPVARTTQVADAQPGTRIAERYRVERVLGRGGMAIVYRVEDVSSGRVLALKQLMVDAGSRLYREVVALFEREYRTLAQLSHPRIVAVHDFGVDGRPFYTMELLEGADLRERAPLPWREACGVIHDVCSTLALLHSRRLVHRDVSPRNVRSARDGTAKLIDFGALAPFGPSAQVVGTPPFVPPEVVHRSALDARTDLFSLGATFYWALTGRLAYPARDFVRLPEIWALRPPPPSSIVAGVPAAIDELVMSLIALDPALRPRSAFEVMQRVSALADLPGDESLAVSQAYLSMPVVVGRDDPLRALRVGIERALASRGGALLVQGRPGIGRSRMLDAGALEAKTAGAIVLRANASLADRELGLIQVLAGQLFDCWPEAALSAAAREPAAVSLCERDADGAPRVRQLSAAQLDRATLQQALLGWFFHVSDSRALLILVDDVHKADDASLALLAALARAAESRRLLLVTTLEAAAPVRAPEPLEVLRRYAVTLNLRELSRPETEALLASVFGDVPHLGLVSDRLFQVAGGNPRDTLELAQWLVSKQRVRYEAGSWSLPGQLELAELPHDLAEVFRERLTELSPGARVLAQAHALCLHASLDGDEYLQLARHAGIANADDAVTELLAQQIVASKGHSHVLTHRGWVDAARDTLDADARRARHRALAALYDRGGDHVFERAHHLLSSGSEDDGLELVLHAVKSCPDAPELVASTTLHPLQLAAVLASALDYAEVAQGRAQSEAHELRRALAAISVATDDSYYFRVRAEWFARLREDSGLASYEALSHVADPQQRLMQALTRATEKYQSTPEHERVYDPEAAIRGLVYYTLVTIALGSRTQANEQLATLPQVLEPFAALSPIIAAIAKNALALREAFFDALPERALAHWLEVQAMLANVTAAELPIVETIRAALWYGIGAMEAQSGLDTAEERAQLLDRVPLQQVGAMAIRKIARLHQGDFEGAEHYRKQGEALSLLSPVRQMFTGSAMGELIAYGMAGDLAGVRQTGDAVNALAARYPGWLPYKHLADGIFERIRGRLDAALDAFALGLALCEPDPAWPGRALSTWPLLESGYIEVLIGLGRSAEAKARGERALAICSERGVVFAALGIERSLALAEGKLGEYASAAARLERHVLALSSAGVTGLQLGATYEARARIAIWAGDRPAIEEYGRLTAKEYRHGERSPLGALYQRLMDEAERAGVKVLPQLTDFETKLTTAMASSARNVTRTVTQEMARADSREKRVQLALGLLCESRGARAGLLYLNGRDGLVLAATLGPVTPSPRALSSARAYLAEQLAATDTATVVHDEADGLAPLPISRTQPSDSEGLQPLLLIGELDGAHHCAGVVMLEATARTQTDASALLHIAEGLASYLLLAGDAEAVPDPRPA